jgi:hypothetical protein
MREESFERKFGESFAREFGEIGHFAKVSRNPGTLHAREPGRFGT